MWWTLLSPPIHYLYIRMQPIVMYWSCSLPLFWISLLFLGVFWWVLHISHRRECRESKILKTLGVGVDVVKKKKRNSLLLLVGKLSRYPMKAVLRSSNKNLTALHMADPCSIPSISYCLWCNSRSNSTLGLNQRAQKWWINYWTKIQDDLMYL